MRNKKENEIENVLGSANAVIDALVEDLARLETHMEKIKQESLALQLKKREAEERVQELEAKTINLALEAEKQIKDMEAITLNASLDAEQRIKDMEAKTLILSEEQKLLEKEQLLKQDSESLHIKQQRYFVLPNLLRKNEEAISDAIAYFEKKCPYCDTNLFEGHFRNKIEIDHYIPISKGGQDVPWNLLPVCKKCNRHKRDKMPEGHLDITRRQNCEGYLNSVRERLTNEIQDYLEQYHQIKSYLMSQKDQLSSRRALVSHNTLLPIYKILNIELQTPELADLPSHEIKDEERLIEYIATCRVRMLGGDMTIGELIIAAAKEHFEQGDFSREAAQKELGRFGIKVKSGHIYIANRCKPIKKLLDGTPWVSDWSRPLKNLEGAEAVDPMYFAPGITSRAVRLPVNIFAAT